MNKKTTLLLFALSIGALSGCHKHQFATTWSYNEKGHFHLCECGEHDRIKQHEFGKWYTKVDATNKKEGVAERKCGVCGYAEHKSIGKLDYKAITIEINGTTEEVRTDSEGNYVLDIPEDEEGKYFAGFFDSENNPFSYFGKIDEDITIHAEFSNAVPEIDSEESMERALRSGVRTAKLITDISITQPHYVLSSIRIIADGARTITRNNTFDGDLFVVGITSSYKAVSSVASAVEFTLDGNDEGLTLEGGLVESKGSAIFAAGASTVNLRKSVTIQNFFKTNNERVLHYNKVGDESGNISEAMKVGAAAIFSYESTINLDGAVLSANQVNDDNTHVKVSSYGGAIFSCGPLNIIDAIFNGNYGSYGSCVYSLRMANVKKAIFDHNVSYNYGTFYMADSQYSNIFMNADNADDIIFTYNQAANSGGAIFGAIASTLQLTNVKFDHNSAGNGGNGGAITTKGIISKCENCVFDTNTCDQKGGAIYQYCAFDDDEEVYVAHTANISGCTFSNNGGSLGGALGVGFSEDDEHKVDGEYAVFATMNVSNCTFNDNAAYKSASAEFGHGGALYAQKGAHLNVANSTFTDNTAVEYGGVLYSANKGQVTFNKCQFETNSAAAGGAIFLNSSSTMSVTNKSKFLSNSTTGNGGAIHMKSESTALIDDTTFTSNAAAGGGAIYIKEESTAITITNSTFSSNTATSNGGALYIYTSSSAVLKGITATSNTATNYGGFMYQSGKSTVSITDITSDGNGAKQGGFVYITTADTTLYIYSGSTANCTADAATDGNIYSNAASAHVYIKGTNTKTYFDYDGTLFAGKGSIADIPNA